MKNIIVKFRDWIIFALWALLIFWIANAAVSLTATSWEWLTAAKWNDLVNKVSWVYTDGSGNVGIWTDTPQNNFSVFKWTPSGIVWDTLDSYSIADFTTNTNEDWIKRGLTIWAPTSNINSPVFLKVTWTSNRMWFLNQFDNENLTILDNWNVGIWVNSPQSALHLWYNSWWNAKFRIDETHWSVNWNCVFEVNYNSCASFWATWLWTNNWLNLCMKCY